MASFGMMNPAYFVSKNILIEWINQFLEINIEKVETMANGAIYCNLWDALHPGTIPMSRVDFTAKYDYDYAKNWKLIQNGFQKAEIKKLIPVQRLIKARYQDNLEFLQWMYKYARDTYNGDPDEPTYDAVGRRSKSKGGRDYTGSSNNSRARRKQPRGGNGKENRSSRPTSAAMQRGGNGPSRQSKGRERTDRGDRQSASENMNSAAMAELEQLRNENKALREECEGVKAKLDGIQSEHEEISTIAKDIEKERDFYFSKVVAIENILKTQSDQEAPLLKQVYELLYQTEEDQQQKQLQQEQEEQQQQMQQGQQQGQGQGQQGMDMGMNQDGGDANGMC